MKLFLSVSSSFFSAKAKRHYLQYQLVLHVFFFFQHERDTAILMQKVFSFIGKEQGKKVENKPNSGCCLMQKCVSTYVSTDMLKLPGLIRMKTIISVRIKSIEMKSCNITFLGEKMCLKSPIGSVMKTFPPWFATRRRFKYDPVIFA